MPVWGTAEAGTPARPALLALLAVLALGAVAAAPASASVSARSVVAGCGADHMTVAGSIRLSGRDARRARGAVLQMRFSALPLFGLPRSAAWRSVGKKTSGSGQEAFTGLGAEMWSGVMSWRFKKGRKTVASGIARSQPGRVGRTRGSGSCTLPEGAKPADTIAPLVFVLPVDEIWHRGPASVQVYAVDDFSGVRAVSYSIDGGPDTGIPNNGTFAIDSEGAHDVRVKATDVAGNTGVRDVIVRVDTAPPSKPAMTAPVSVTASTAPTFSWTAASDSGSGVKGYFLQIKRASDGSVISFTSYDAATTSVASPVTLNDGESYIASVGAVDNTDSPFSSESDPITFRVDTQPGIDSSSPPNGGIVSGPAKSANLTLTLDRPADKSTVASSTVPLTGVDPSRTNLDYTVTCDASCTTITIDPADPLAEGRYAITLSGVRSQEGVTIPGTVRFAVPFEEGGTAQTPSVCVGDGAVSKIYTLSTNDSLEQGRFTFNWSINESSTWTARVWNGTSQSTPLGPEIGGSGTSGPGTITFNLGAKSGDSFNIEFRVHCVSSSTRLTVTNLLGTRLP